MCGSRTTKTSTYLDSFCEAPRVNESIPCSENTDSLDGGKDMPIKGLSGNEEGKGVLQTFRNSLIYTAGVEDEIIEASESL